MTVKHSLPSLAAGLLWAAVTLPANATPIAYTLSGATATFNSPSGTVSLSGSFTFDPAGPTLDSVMINATSTPADFFPIIPEVFTTPETAAPGAIQFGSIVSPVETDTIDLFFCANFRHITGYYKQSYGDDVIGGPNHIHDRTSNRGSSPGS